MPYPHYISKRHRDREWYRPIAEFRVLLVDVIDTLLDLLPPRGPHPDAPVWLLILFDGIEAQ